MYTIIMNKDKSLSATIKSTLYQREKLVDKIQFLLPQEYGELELAEFTAMLKYIDQGNEAHTEILVKDEELYKNRIRYTLPVDTSLNKFSGNITIRLTLTKTNMETKSQYVLHTGEITINISPLSDWYKFVSDDALETIDQKILELEAKIEATEKIAEIYDSKKADNITRVDIDKIQLKSNGTLIGDPVTITNNNDENNNEFEVVEF